MTESAMFIAADWPAPAHVHACVSTRQGGCSAAPRDSLNLAQHVGDDPAAVARNRAILASALGLPAEPAWLDQVHGCAVVEARPDGIVRRGDAAHTSAPGVVCAVMTADCLPVLLTDRAGTQVAAVHCGWRGLAAGVLAAAVARFGCPGTELIAWLGPAISQRAFEVGPEVREAFLAPCRHEAARGAVRAAFLPGCDGAPRYHADLYALARIALAALGVNRVYGGGFCTFGSPQLFYSYRRDGVTGRMASLIWISHGPGDA
ncbi:MAG: peptidoglycan editing factor PgeF [Pseudomonadales bacterium]|nr:peptidoglycan editing factor PgeF [Pseudomonadales bacterium]